MEETKPTKQAATAVPALKRFNDKLRDVNVQAYLQDMLGSKRETFVTNLVAVVSNNKALQECLPMSLVYAAMKATALDFPLDPNFGFAYLIPYRDNRSDVTVAQLQFGYKAYIQLAQRTGQYRLLNVTEIREGELVSRDFITGEYQFVEVADRLSKPIIGYAACLVLNTGFKKVLYMTKEEAEAHALRYSQTYHSSNQKVKASSKWSTDFDAMAMKTVLKALLSKYGPLSTQMSDAIKFDQAVINNNGEAEYLDNPAEEVSYEDVAEAVKAQKEEMRGKEATADGTLNLP